MILVFSILTSLHISDTFQFSSKINITNVLHQYTQLCGPKHLCNTSSIAALSSVNGIFDNWSPCPDCSCDSNCYSRDNCCPDKLSTTCENTVLVIGTAEDNGRNYTHMVSECPENTEADLISKCNEKITKKNYLQKYPVTGYTSQNASITFKNRDCAICNNVHNFNTWNLDISCSNRQFSITQYSSAEEIWDAIESDTSCTMKYDPADDNGIKPCKLESNLVNKCNVTGIWKKYDRDIEWACEKYDQKFGVFRNVFCYLCNIDEINLSNLSHVKECNVTGLWTKYSAKISKACLTKKSEPWFLPFYNRYCFHCNTNGKTRSGVLIDSKINMKESFHPLEQSPFFTNITISFLKEHNSIENEKFDIKRPSNTELHEEFGINITWLYTAYREAGGKSRWCSKQFQTGENGECLCDPSCYFIGLCCPDFVLTATTLVNIYSTVLFGENANNNSQRYILIGSCPKNYKNKTIVQKCENPVVDDITTLIPVNNQDGYKYRNMYCNFCNNGTNRRMKFWKIHLKCPVYVSFKHFTSLKTLLTFAATTGCIGRTMPPEPETKKETFVAKCNVTGDWTSYDRHIEYACENPLVSSLIAFPSHKKEFQNVFCKMCNYNHLEDIRPIIKIDTFSIVSKGTLSVKPFRTLFSLKDLVDDSESKHHNGTLIQGSCESKYVYDVYKIKCRKIFCALGKRFKNGKCVPLFDYVYDLKYQIAIRLESEYLTDLQISKTMEAFHSKDTIISKITETLSLYQNTNTTSLDWYYAQFNLPCHASGQRLTRGTLYATQSEPHNNTDVQILEVLINFCVGIKTTYSVSRTKIEEQLLNITQNPVIFQVGNESLSFRPKLDKKALYLKSTIHLTESESHCNVLREEETRGNSDSKSTLRPLLVNRLLFCAQIEIGPEEFTFISDESIRIKGLNSILGYEKYQMHPNDKIRLCVEDYIPSQEMKPASVFHLTLEILTFICICLSIVCLLLTCHLDLSYSGLLLRTVSIFAYSNATGWLPGCIHIYILCLHKESIKEYKK
ncbi:hypothetical protein KUTeg_008635 [Tegillarca granosa]|uniref:SMB domain-containing protein n=1 Tax=Tegillarca granosa TaxID=220873 RepID=A0ABQ9F9N5_TEGGR|nr:hypothetical protein KUTeg_008635 [Tegillarca granosa]